MNWQQTLNLILAWARDAAIRLFVSLIIVFVSFRIVNAIARKIERSSQIHHSDKTVFRAISYVFKIGLKTVIIICIVGYLGIDTSGLTALIASLGVGIGLAVNGALSNLAGGVIIIITRPFRIDDYIEAQGYSGTVVDIHITNTKLKTPDNKTIFLPNGQLSSGAIVNYSMQKTRRIDEILSVPNSVDFNRVKTVLTEIVEDHPLVLSDPAIFIRISERTASSTKVILRVWVKSEDFWTVKFDLAEAVKSRFSVEGIEIPPEHLSVKIEKSS